MKIKQNKIKMKLWWPRIFKEILERDHQKHQKQAVLQSVFKETTSTVRTKERVDHQADIKIFFRFFYCRIIALYFPGGSVSKEFICNAGNHL